MKNLNLLKMGMMLAMFTVAGAAQADEQKLDQRVENQKARIGKLEEKGAISKEEAASLNQKVDATAAKAEAAKADGLSKEERKEIRKDLRANHREIKKARLEHKLEKREEKKKQ